MRYSSIQRYVVPVVVSVLLGLSLALQVKTQVKVQQTLHETRVTEERVAQFLQVTQERDRIREELARLREAASRQATQAQLQEELLLELAAAGLVEVSGPGVQVVLSDLPGTTGSTRQVRVEDILLVLNDLRAAGAEALAINGIRVTPSLALQRVPDQGTLLVNGLPSESALHIEAVGDPSVLMASLHMRGGVVQQLQPWVDVKVESVPDLVIPAVPEPPEYYYSRVKR